MIGRVAVVPRARPSAPLRLGVSLLALVVALAIGAALLAGVGADPAEAYRTMFDSSLNGWAAIRRTLLFATPLVLTGLAAAVAFRMRVYNIGAEGQLFIGAIAAAGIGVALPDGVARPITLVVVLGGGVLAGAGWAALAAVPKARFGTDEIITTLMLNFVALGLMNYLIFGSMSPWRDPVRPVPQGRQLPASADLPVLDGRLHVGIVIAVALALVLWFVLRSTTFGFRMRVVGDSPRAARYAGMRVPVVIVVVMAISGGLAGLAGAIEVTGVNHSLEPRALAVELGYTGIVVAAVARFNPLAVVPVAVFFAALSISGGTLQSLGVPVAIVLLLQGLVFLVVTAGEFFVSNRIVRRSRPVAAMAPTSDEPIATDPEPAGSTEPTGVAVPSAPGRWP